MPVTFNYGFQSTTNVFTPSFDQTAGLVLNYARNQKDYVVNQLSTITPVKQVAGNWLRLDPNDVVRMNQDLSRTFWYDGQPLEADSANKQRHTFLTYNAQRRVPPGGAIQRGYNEVKQAAWDLQATDRSVLANKMMLVRTKAFFDALFNTDNHLTDHVSTATSLGGGFWDNATSTLNYIQKTFTEVARRILLDSNGVVDMSQLTLVLDPYSAQRMGQTQEVRDYLAQQVNSIEYIRGEMKNTAFGLPDKMYGVRIVVDKSVANYANIGATANRQFLANASNQVAFLARPGDLVNTGDLASSFSTVHFFVVDGQEMQTYSYDDVRNMRYENFVYEYWDVKVVSPETGYIVTSVFSS